MSELPDDIQGVLDDPHSARGHHDACDKRWTTAFGAHIGPDGCPTCRALRADTQVYCTAVLEQMYARPEWSFRRADE